jgi:putative component of membrane protein insertase Oxa1/YidC/SpoIIIJ protein YidD
MQALIDNSPTQGVQCDIRPDCSKYMYDGRFNVV